MGTAKTNISWHEVHDMESKLKAYNVAQSLGTACLATCQASRPRNLSKAYASDGQRCYQASTRCDGSALRACGVFQRCNRLSADVDDDEERFKVCSGPGKDPSD